MKLLIGLLFFCLIIYSHAKELITTSYAKAEEEKYELGNGTVHTNLKTSGLWTDNFGNYGNWSTIVNAEIENNMLKYHAFSLKYSYQDGSTVFAKGNRTNEELEQGIGKAKYISAPKKLSPLIGTVCNYGVTFLKETAFVIFKCDITPEAKKLLTSIKKIK